MTSVKQRKLIQQAYAKKFGGIISNAKRKECTTSEFPDGRIAVYYRHVLLHVFSSEKA